MDGAEAGLVSRSSEPAAFTPTFRKEEYRQERSPVGYTRGS